MIDAGLLSLDEGGNDAVVSLADEKHKGRRAVGGARTDHAAAAVERLKSIVAGAGLAADGKHSTVGEFERAGEPARSTLVDYLGHGFAHGAGDLRGEHRLAFFL